MDKLTAIHSYEDQLNKASQFFQPVFSFLTIEYRVIEEDFDVYYRELQELCEGDALEDIAQELSSRPTILDVQEYVNSELLDSKTEFLTPHSNKYFGRYVCHAYLERCRPDLQARIAFAFKASLYEGESYQFNQILGELGGLVYEDFCGEITNDLKEYTVPASKNSDHSKVIHAAIIEMKKRPQSIAMTLHQLKGKAILEELLQLPTEKAMAIIEFYSS